MKTLVISILALFLSSPGGYALDENSTGGSAENKFEAKYFGRGLIDGFVWKQLTEREKAFYLFGFEDGVMGIALHFIPEGKDRDNVYNTLPTSTENCPQTSEIIKSIDEFYSDDKNTAIPMYYVLLVIKNRLAGVDEAKIQNYIEYLRNSEGKDLEEAVEEEGH
ncbi:MAG: hypothetical protein A2Z72_02010 [Omnitrophica bacterium RBG_13_46_9]|nr:MAG: hypothetical protein A2Z72_02010 [Omnitrophica bacterium RBG_13_46_9]